MASGQIGQGGCCLHHLVLISTVGLGAAVLAAGGVIDDSLVGKTFVKIPEIVSRLG